MGNELRKLDWRMWRVKRSIDGKMRRVGRWIDAEMRRVRYRRRWAYWWRFGYGRRWVGLSAIKMGLSATKWAYRQWFINGFGFETVANGYWCQLPEPSRIVRNDWVWVWVRTVVNGYWRWFGKLSAMVIGDRLGFYQQRRSEDRQWWGSVD